MSLNIECCIPISHPSVVGHFPGNPIIPAVIILNEVIVACNEWQPNFRITGIVTAKFIAPLRPDESFIIYLDTQNKSTIKFECRSEKQIFATGKLQISDSKS